jgi:hypothetical protein
MACYRECSEVGEDFCTWLFTSVIVQGGNYVALIRGTYNEDGEIHVSLIYVRDGAVFIKPCGSNTGVD